MSEKKWINIILLSIFSSCHSNIQTLIEMIPVEIQHYYLNRILLLIIGLWPHQQSKFVQVQFIFFFAILSTGIIFQVKKEYNII